MRDDDVVLGVVVAGEARAYPWWIVKHFHVVNDTIGRRARRRRLLRAVHGGGRLPARAGRPGPLHGGPRRLQRHDHPQGPRDAARCGPRSAARASRGRWPGRRSSACRSPSAAGTSGRRAIPETDVLWGPEQARGGHGSWYEPGKWGIVAEMGATLEGLGPPPAREHAGLRRRGPGTAKSYPLAELKAAAGRERPARRRRRWWSPRWATWKSRGSTARFGAGPHLLSFARPARG